MHLRRRLTHTTTRRHGPELGGTQNFEKQQAGAGENHEATIGCRPTCSERDQVPQSTMHTPPPHPRRPERRNDSCRNKNDQELPQRLHRHPEKLASAQGSPPTEPRRAVATKQGGARFPNKGEMELKRTADSAVRHCSIYSARDQNPKAQPTVSLCP